MFSVMNDLIVFHARFDLLISMFFFFLNGEPSLYSVRINWLTLPIYDCNNSISKSNKSLYASYPQLWYVFPRNVGIPCNMDLDRATASFCPGGTQLVSYLGVFSISFLLLRSWIFHELTIVKFHCCVRVCNPIK